MTASELLRRAGWAEGRQVVVDPPLAALREGGFETWEGLASMLAEYCFLTIHDVGGLRSLWIEPTRAVADADPEWIADYEQSLGTRLVPVGGYSHMLVMYGRDSVFYGGFDREFGPLGLTVEEVVDGLLCRVPPVRLSMTLQ
jgi:hypothetical protein